MTDIHSLNFVLQALEQLDIEDIEITDVKAQLLANAIENNPVIVILFSLISQIIHPYFFIQTITALYLMSNQISQKGVEYIADALGKNTVIIIQF